MGKAKNFLKAVPCINGKLNDAFYRRFGSNEEMLIEIIDKLGRIDSISDIAPLKDFRRSISNGSSIFYTTNANVSNSLIYGIWESMFGSHRDKALYLAPAVEHGLIFHKQIFTDLKYTARPCSVTFGDFRRECIRHYKKTPIFCVGPYILYSSPYYSEEEVESIKQANGKTLLVFPAHSTNLSEVTRDQRLYINAINEIAHDFDTVIINAYWWNINDKIIDAFQAEGYKIVSAGFRDDPNFLSRLRTIIEMSDLVVGDSVGTHLGYSLALGVPFRYLKTGTLCFSTTGSDEENLNEMVDERRTIANSFINSSSIGNQQLDVCEPYWGFSYHRSKEDLECIYQISERIAVESHFWANRYPKTAKKLLAEYEREDEKKYHLLVEAMK
jgi:hypothetical protein